MDKCKCDSCKFVEAQECRTTTDNRKVYICRKLSIPVSSKSTCKMYEKQEIIKEK